MDPRVVVTRALVNVGSLIGGHFIGNVLVEFRHIPLPKIEYGPTEVPQDEVVDRTIYSARMEIENYGVEPKGSNSSFAPENAPDPVIIRLQPTKSNSLPRGTRDTEERASRMVYFDSSTKKGLSFDTYFSTESPILPASEDMDSAFGVEATADAKVSRPLHQTARLVNAVFQSIIMGRLDTMASVDNDVLSDVTSKHSDNVHFRAQLRVMAGCIVFMNLINTSLTKVHSSSTKTPAVDEDFLIHDMNILGDYMIHAMLNERFGYRTATRRMCYDLLWENMKNTHKALFIKTNTAGLDSLPSKKSWRLYIRDSLAFNTIKIPLMENTFDFAVMMSLIQFFPSFVVTDWSKVSNLYPSAATFLPLIKETSFSRLCPQLQGNLASAINLPGLSGSARGLGMFLVTEPVDGDFFASLSSRITAQRSQSEWPKTLWRVEDAMNADEMFSVLATDEGTERPETKAIHASNYTSSPDLLEQRLLNHTIGRLKAEVDKLDRLGEATGYAIGKKRLEVFANRDVASIPRKASAAMRRSVAKSQGRDVPRVRISEIDATEMALSRLANVMARSTLVETSHLETSLSATMRSIYSVDDMKNDLFVE